MKNQLYLLFRKTKAYFESFVFLFMAWLYPIRSNKVVFCSTEGMGGYGDNPKAIAEDLHQSHPELELVWLTNNDRKQFPSYIRKASHTLWSRAYEYTTAKIWVDSHRKPYGTRKREGQYYIQTWHGPIAFKPLGADRGDKLPKIAELVSCADSALIDIFLSNSQWNEDMIKRALYYHGKISRVGSPRCDVLFHDIQQQREAIRKKYKIPLEAKILLFAPTFRAGSQQRKRTVIAHPITLNFGNVIWALEAKTKCEWYVMLRLHPQVAAWMEKFPVDTSNAKIVDASQYRDAHELLAASDALLTDYSSLAFDASYIFLPVFLHCDDLEEYQADRNNLYFDMRKLPFPFAATEEELINNINGFELVGYRKRVKQMQQQLHITEDGKASERTRKIIEDLIER